MKRLVLCAMIVVGWHAASAADPQPKPDRAAPDQRRDERFVARGQVDLFVASMVALDFKDDDERRWSSATKLGAKVLSLVETPDDDERKPQGSPAWFADFAAYRKSKRVDFVRAKGTYNRPVKNKAGERILYQAIQAGGVEAEQSINGLVVSRGPVTAPQNINDSLILATGDVRAGTSDEIAISKNVGNTSVIICDGDVRMKGINRCIIIARGNIAIEGGSDYCTLIAGGTVVVGKLPSPPQPGEPPQDAFRRRAVIKEKETKPLGFIMFFELHRIGLKVKVAESAVTVETVGAKSEAEKAGLKAGDVILETSSKKPTDAESLRRLLRDALAVGDAAVKVKRGNSTLTLKVSLPE